MKKSVLKLLGCAALFGMVLSASAVDVTTDEAFRNAVAAGGEVTLAADITLAGEVSVATAVTLDLGVYTLAAPGNAIEVVGGGELTVNGTTGAIRAGVGKFAIYTDYEAHQGKKKVTINGGVFDGLQFNRWNHSGEKADPTVVTINGGRFRGAVGGYRLYPMTVNGGFFEQGLPATEDGSVYATSICYLGVNGGTYKMGYVPEANGDKVRLATTDGFVTYQDDIPYFTFGSSASCPAVRNGLAYANIADAFRGIGANTVVVIIDHMATDTINVTLGDGDSVKLVGDNQLTMKVTAANGLTVHESKDAEANLIWSATSGDMEALVDGTYYATFGEAVVSAPNGERVTLLKDCANKVTAINKSVEIYLNNRALTFDSSVIGLTDDAVVTVTGQGHVNGIPYVNGGKLVIKGGTYQFDPTERVTLLSTSDLWRKERFYVKQDGESSWTVTPVPVAYVSRMDVSEAGTEVDAAYTFKAFSDKDFSTAERFLDNEGGLQAIQHGSQAELEEALEALPSKDRARMTELLDQMAPFQDWIADFAVCFDQKVDAGSLGLYGQYTAWSNEWLGKEAPEDIAAGETKRLLKDFMGVNGGINTYAMIAGYVRIFNCGAKSNPSANLGTTTIVQLRLYDPKDQTKSILICEYRYTFGDYAGKIGEGGEKLSAQQLVEQVKDGQHVYLLNDIFTPVAVNKAITVHANGFIVEDGMLTAADGYRMIDNGDYTWTFKVMGDVHGDDTPPEEVVVTDANGDPLPEDLPQETKNAVNTAVSNEVDAVVGSLADPVVTGAETGIGDVVKENKSAIVVALEESAAEQGLTEAAKAQIADNIDKYVKQQTGDDPSDSSATTNFLDISVSKVSATVAVLGEATVVATPKTIVYDVKPIIETVVSNVTAQGTTVEVVSTVIPNETIKEMADQGKPVTFNLKILDETANSALVLHQTEDPSYPDETFTCPIWEKGGERYITISTAHFSLFTVTTTAAVLVDSEETIGLFKIAGTSAGEVAFGVPFIKSGVTNGAAATLADLVTTGRQTGDAARGWTVGNDDKSAYAAVAAATEVATGDAIWYSRSAASDVPLTLGGYVVTNGIRTAVTTSVTERAGMTLLVNPYRTAVDILPKLSGRCENGDQIVLEGDTKRYFYEDSVWYVSTPGSVTREKGNVKIRGAETKTPAMTVDIPAGKAFWYVSKGGTLVVEW